ncbi:MAG: DUF4123 domain-containing protein [Phycisphaerales bacterium]|nr:DUF4123 domain-containing protein [Phycisphaerales bacterium]
MSTAASQPLDPSKRAPSDWHSPVLDRPPARGPWKDAATDPLAAVKSEVLSHLRSREGTVFGLFDAARDDRILELFRAHGVPANLPDDRRLAPPPDDPSRTEFECLYVGRIKETTGSSGPWIVRLPKDSSLLAALVMEGWGKAWGYYIVSEATLYELRKHFRHFLMVRLPNGRAAWFRLADPRIIGAFLPACTVEERARVEGGAIDEWIVEATDGGVMPCS